MKYCTQCGVQQEKEAKFCTQCGYNFETKETPNQAADTGEATSGSKVRFNKKGIVAIAVILLLGVVAYFAFGGVDIAGNYNNGSETIEINRNGKMTATTVEGLDSETLQFTAYLDYDDLSEGYVVDPSKDVEIEVSIPTEALHWGNSTGRDIAFAMDMFGLDQKESGEMTVITGKLTPIQAEMMDIDLSDILIEEGPDGIFIDGEFYREL